MWWHVMSVFLAVAALAGPAGDEPGSPFTALAKARAAYSNRNDAAQARAAVELFGQAALADPNGYTPRWEGARAAYFLASFPLRGAPGAERSALLEEGVRLAREAVALRPDEPEGLFWLGVVLGASGEVRGVWASLRVVGEIRRLMKRCLELDPAVANHGPDRVLGRLEFKLPALAGGSVRRSIAHLERSLEGSPNESITWLFLAESVRATGDRDRARELLRAALEVEPDPEYLVEDRWVKDEARALLTRW